VRLRGIPPSRPRVLWTGRRVNSAFQGTVSYDRGASLSGGTITEVHWLDLTIGPDDTMLVESSAGLCLNPPESDVRRAIARGLRSISCGKVRFTVEPAGSTLRGEMAVSYIRSTRKRGSCISYNAQGVCLDYNYDIEERQATQRGSLRVQPRG
jgi:hypothetical protein